MKNVYVTSFLLKTGGTLKLKNVSLGLKSNIKICCCACGSGGREACECGQAVGNTIVLSTVCPHASKGTSWFIKLVHISIGIMKKAKILWLQRNHFPVTEYKIEIQTGITRKRKVSVLDIPPSLTTKTLSLVTVKIIFMYWKL